MQTLDINQVILVRIIRETFAFTHVFVILKSMTQTRENWTPMFWVELTLWMVWRCHDILRVSIFFLVRTNTRKEYLDENNFRHCYGNFFKGVILKVTWSQVRWKFLANIDQAYWQQRFESHPTVEDFTNIDQDICLFFYQDFSKHHDTKIDEVVWKTINCTKIRVYTSKNT